MDALSERRGRGVMLDAEVVGVRLYKNHRIELRADRAGAGVFALIRAPGGAARQVRCEGGPRTVVGLLRRARAAIEDALRAGP